MTDTRDDSFKERLIMVEQQQNHQKEVLVEINETLREVVKTQHILANQRKEIDRLNKDSEEMLRRMHLSDIDDARKRTKEDQQKKIIDDLHRKIIDEIEPRQTKHTFFFKLGTVVLAGGWALFLVFVKWWLENQN